MARISKIQSYTTVAERVNVSMNHLPMLKFEGLNLGTSILKFSLFQFSNWLNLDKYNNHGILIVVLALND